MTVLGLDFCEDKLIWVYFLLLSQLMFRLTTLSLTPLIHASSFPILIFNE
jgi:hypothetical protein